VKGRNEMMLTVLLIASLVQGQNGLLGAKKVDEIIEASQSKDIIAQREDAWIKERDYFAARSDSLSPKDAGDRWLKLLDDIKNVPLEILRGGTGLPFPSRANSQAAFSVLPRPESWPHIEQAVAKWPVSRNREALKLIFARL
jgi:hypothetical protein